MPKKTGGTLTVVGPPPVDESAQVMELFRVAIEKGGDAINGLEQLVTLHERVSKRRAELQFYDDISAFQGTLKKVTQNKVGDIVSQRAGTQFNYRYANYEATATALREAMTPFGFSFTHTTSLVGQGMVESECFLRHRMGHMISAKAQCPTSSNAGMSEQQRYSSAESYCKRRSLIAVCGLIVGEPEPDDIEAETTPVETTVVAQIDELLKSTGANRERFLKHFGIEKLEQLSAAQQNEALGLLNRKKGAKP